MDLNGIQGIDSTSIQIANMCLKILPKKYPMEIVNGVIDRNYE
jgi:hypothetical protein